MRTTGTALALLATSVVAFSGMSIASSTPAEAQWRGGHYYGRGYAPGPRYYRRGGNGGRVALGIAGGLLAAGALAAAASPAYGYPAYGYGAPVVYGPRCRWRLQTVWNPYWGGYERQRVRVCY